MPSLQLLVEVAAVCLILGNALHQPYRAHIQVIRRLLHDGLGLYVVCIVSCHNCIHSPQAQCTSCSSVRSRRVGIVRLSYVWGLCFLCAASSVGLIVVLRAQVTVSLESALIARGF